jgi:hypothetical protein
MLSLSRAPALLCSGHLCTTGDLTTELTFSSCKTNDAFSNTKNATLARQIIKEVYQELEIKNMEDRNSYEKAGLCASTQRSNVWETYTDKERLRAFAAQSMEFVRTHPDCRMRNLTTKQLRFLVMLQHFISEDTSDFYRPECERKHMDSFEGVNTDAVNSQLVKDAHRSEWSIEGRSFSLQQGDSAGGSTVRLSVEEQKQRITRFQRELVAALEDHLLGFCRRRGLTSVATKRLLQAVTTQMSQCGLANLDRSSEAAKYFVHGQGLDQRTTYNISTMVEGGQEMLKLSLLCMKTGFTQFHTQETLGLEHASTLDTSPRLCKPSSYLYQYATLRFCPCHSTLGLDKLDCTVLDALDEVHIVDMSPEPV